MIIIRIDSDYRHDYVNNNGESMYIIILIIIIVIIIIIIIIHIIINYINSTCKINIQFQRGENIYVWRRNIYKCIYIVYTCPSVLRELQDLPNLEYMSRKRESLGCRR